jgi:hypothetical protein
MKNAIDHVNTITEKSRLKGLNLTANVYKLSKISKIQSIEEFALTATPAYCSIQSLIPPSPPSKKGEPDSKSPFLRTFGEAQSSRGFRGIGLGAPG